MIDGKFVFTKRIFATVSGFFRAGEEPVKQLRMSIRFLECCGWHGERRVRLMAETFRAAKPGGDDAPRADARLCYGDEA